MDIESVKAKLVSLLGDKPRGTAADVTEHTVVCLNGTQLIGFRLCADYPGFDGIFDIDHNCCGDMHEHLVEWFADPRFSSRPDLLDWLDRAALTDGLKPDA
ncbi:hypothetical protein LJR034_008821 [Caballeronia sp. LjRoot34]|uniref:hypothetical protein n=1 Tax=Caballeronia sp. LjRoot34 TaxID=3342325 RepID=UPI003ECEB042